jgi:hypothetical protein
MRLAALIGEIAAAEKSPTRVLRNVVVRQEQINNGKGLGVFGLQCNGIAGNGIYLGFFGARAKDYEHGQG